MMRTKLQITPSTDLERRLSAVQRRKLRMQLPHGLTIVYLVGSLLCTCLYFVEFLAFLPNVSTSTGMVIFMGLAIAAAWALNRYNRQVAAHWKQQINDRLITELAAQQLTHHDVDIAELKRLLTKLNVRIIRTSDNTTSLFLGAIESSIAIVNLENPGSEIFIVDANHRDRRQKVTNKQIDQTDDPLTKFKPGWYMLCRFNDQRQQTLDYRLSDPVPVRTVEQLVDVIVQILITKVKFKHVRSAKH